MGKAEKGDGIYKCNNQHITGIKGILPQNSEVLGRRLLRDPPVH